METASLAHLLPSINAGLNSLSGVFLLLGLFFIRKKNARMHKAIMLGACVISALFLACYLLRMVLTGTHRFVGAEPFRTLYLGILTTHMILAAMVPVLAFLAVRHGLRGNLLRHKRIVKYLFPMWMYVSVTGVVVYAMLYHWPA